MNIKFFLFYIFLFCTIASYSDPDPPGFCNCADNVDEDGIPYIPNPLANCSLATCPFTDEDDKGTPDIEGDDEDCCIRNPDRSGVGIPVNSNISWLFVIGGIFLVGFYFREKLKQS